jgi:sulfite reductase (NADPH) flavoprotein alpha-component
MAKIIHQWWMFGAVIMQNTLTLRLIGKQLLSKVGGPKEAFQLTFEQTSGERFDYECGDSVALWPENDPADVEKILRHWKIDGQQEISGVAVGELLRKQYCIMHLTEHFLGAVREQLGGQDGDVFDRYRAENALQTASLEDMIDLFPSVKFTAEALLPLLKKIKPRLYSIASATALQADQMDLAIVVVRYENFRKRDRYGVASHYLCHRLPLQKPITAFITRSRFKLPADISKPIIMVGPGTGVAPFRAFLQERAVLRANGKGVGKNWLFFGEQYRASNFYYQNEFERWQASGDLAHLDLAFSRDQDYKIYVQDRMRERSEELWNWLCDGAYFYVCGDAAHMAKDVEIALLDIIRQYGDEDTPENFLRQLKQENRYQRDVY